MSTNSITSAARDILAKGGSAVNAKRRRPGKERGIHRMEMMTDRDREDEGYGIRDGRISGTGRMKAKAYRMEGCQGWGG
jgi:hypothetical protein